MTRGRVPLCPERVPCIVGFRVSPGERLGSDRARACRYCVHHTHDDAMTGSRPERSAHIYMQSTLRNDAMTGSFFCPELSVLPYSAVQVEAPCSKALFNFTTIPPRRWATACGRNSPRVSCLDHTREATPRQRKPGGDIPLGDARRRATPHGTHSNSARHALTVIALLPSSVGL